MTELSPEEWGNRYRALRGTCEALTGRLRTLVVDLLAEENLEVIQIESRTKTVDSFIEKISRKRAKYENPLTEITDLIGVRIITYYLEDVARVGEILKKADKRVGKDVYGKVYSGDWADFAAKTEAWHDRKRRRRSIS